jgi:predicted CoA-binding protein
MVKEKIPYQEAIDDFLAQERIAIAGVSRKGNLPANAIYQKFKDNGYQVFAINPQAAEVEGDPCYSSLAALPTQVDGLVIAGPPSATRGLIEECLNKGVSRVWIHSSIDKGSKDDAAVRYGQEKGLKVIPAGCPMMNLKGDIFHRCLYWMLKVGGKIPKTV